MASMAPRRGRRPSSFPIRRRAAYTLALLVLAALPVAAVMVALAPLSPRSAALARPSVARHTPGQDPGRLPLDDEIPQDLAEPPATAAPTPPIALADQGPTGTPQGGGADHGPQGAGRHRLRGHRLPRQDRLHERRPGAPGREHRDGHRLPHCQPPRPVAGAAGGGQAADRGEPPGAGDAHRQEGARLRLPLRRLHDRGRAAGPRQRLPRRRQHPRPHPPATPPPPPPAPPPPPPPPRPP